MVTGLFSSFAGTTRVTWSTGITHTFPSPIALFERADTTASSTASACASDTRISTRTLGTRSTVARHPGTPRCVRADGRGHWLSGQSLNAEGLQRVLHVFEFERLDHCSYKFHELPSVDGGGARCQFPNHQRMPNPPCPTPANAPAEDPVKSATHSRHVRNIRARRTRFPVKSSAHCLLHDERQHCSDDQCVRQRGTGSNQLSTE